MNDIRNAIITSAEIVIEDHGLLTAWLGLNYGGMSQAFGGYCLHNPKFAQDFGGEFIRRTLDVVDVRSWADLVGKTVRVRCEPSGVHAIGNIIKDNWFTPKSDIDWKGGSVSGSAPASRKAEMENRVT